MIPQPTPLDLHWRMFGIDVRVHPFFWLMSVLLGWYWSDRGLEYLLIWVLCVFVSILIHELGHVLMGRLFGSEGHILLYSFGGLAIGSSNLRSRWQRILVLLAGPGAQFVLFSLILAIAFVGLPGVSDIAAHGQRMPMLETAVFMLLEINLFWAVLNLLPIFPLDGGQISREVLEGFFGDRGIVAALGISCGLAALLAVHSLLVAMGRGLIPFLPIGGWYTAIFFALLAVSSFQLLQAEMNRSRRLHDEERLPWE
jgi:Zn-dependent protease